MKIRDSNGKEIISIDEWSRIYQNPNKAHQWKQYRSAYSVAEFILNHNGTDEIQTRLSEVLGGGVSLHTAIPELMVSFDEYRHGREHDLGIFGETEDGKTFFVGVEAKVDESFGDTTSSVYLSAKSRQIVGISTTAPERIEKLLALHFTKDDPTMFDVRYQLLYATAGTLAVEVDIHVLLVIVFKTPLYDDVKGAKNYRDYIQFMEKVEAKPIPGLHTVDTAHRLSLNGKELICLYDYVEL